MDDRLRRLAALSPERRRLLARLAHEPPVPVPAPLPDDDVRAFYDEVNRRLDAGPFRAHALFLNYGYVPNESPSHARVRPAPGEPARNAVRLVLELVGDLALGETDRVLDVGCGRGGTVHVLRSCFTVGEIDALDLSPVAVAFCRDRLGDARTRFVEGDAHSLPFGDASFDVVTSVESSHSYADLPAFYAEVGRVLRPGGRFLYTDVFPTEEMGDRERALSRAGLEVELRRDVTANVLLSCDETARTNARAFPEGEDRERIERFLGVPGSALYEEMKDGRRRYAMYRLRRLRPPGKSATEPPCPPRNPG